MVLKEFLNQRVGQRHHNISEQVEESYENRK